MLRWSMLKCSSAWIAGSSPAMTNTKSFSRRVCVRVLLTTMHQKDSPSREKAEGSGAPKGASNQCPRGAIRCCHLNALRARCPHPTLPRLRGEGWEGARLPALHRGACQSDRTLRLTGPRFTRKRGRGRCPRRRSRLSGAPRAPVVVPEGSMPEPPENGVTSPARRNRTRSINRPSPVTSLERTGIVPVT
jgi:hypothetical protein